MKGKLEELGEETDENVENISKMQGQILNMTKGKVNIFDGAGNFKSTYEIMQDIADVWDELSSIDQANLLETIAGKNRANDVAALLSNWQNVEAAVKSANEAEGSAAKENAKYIDSIQGRLDKLTTAWQSFANTFMNSDFLKGGISALTTFVELIEKLVDTFGSFGTIGLGAGIFGIFKNRKSFSGILGSLSTFGQMASDAWKSGGKLRDRFKDIGKAAGMAGGDITKSFTGSLSGMIGGIGLAVAAVSLIISAYKNYKEEASKARQETIQASNDFLDASSSFEQAYIKYSGKTNLTAEEEAELETAINGTVDALGDKSSALQQVVNSSNDYVTSLERITDAELKAAEKAAQEKQKNAKLELEDATKDWYTNNTARIQIKNDSTALKIAQEMDTDFLQKETKGKKGHHVSTYWFDMPSDTDADKILDYYYTLVEYKNRLLEVDDFDTNKDIQSAYENVNSTIEKLSESVKVYEDGLYDLAKAEHQASNGIPKTTEAYLEMREAILTREDIARTSLDTRMSILNSLDSEYANIFDLSSAEAQARKFVGIIKGFGDGTKDGTDEIGTVETFLNMRTALNNNECTVGEYLSELDNVTSMSEKFSDEEKKAFNLAFGLDTDSIKKQYEDVYNYISRNYLDKLNTANMSSFDASEFKSHEEQKIKDILNGLSATELQAVANIKGEINWETTNTDEILAQIKDEAKFIEAMNYTIAIDVETESLDALNSALSESVSGVGLSSESIAALKGRYAELESEGYNLSAMFEETSNGIHLNKEAVSELEQALASNKLTETDKQLEVLKGRYDELTTEIDKCRDAGDRAALYTEQQSIVDKINDLATLASQYKGLTSAYNAWQSAESAGSERDMYEGIIEGFETVGDEISRGWMDDGTIKFLELLTGKTDLAGKSGKELKEIYDDLDDTIKNTTYSVRDFFTVDEDGNSTNTGVYNFLDAIGQLEEEKFGGKDIVKRDGKGNVIGFDFELAGGDEVIAEALGVSEELVQIMVRAADDAGFVVNLEGAYTQLADLKTEAESARDTLIDLQKNGLEKLKGIDVNFDLNAEGNDLVSEQEKAINLLDKFKKDGKIDLKMEGAQQALDIAEYLTIKLDDLTEPKYMQLDASKVEEDIREPLEDMQEFEKLAKEKHLLQLTGDTKKIKEVQDDMDEIAQGLEDLDKETKIKLGIDGLTSEEIASKLEKGEIDIPAELKLDVQMSDDLKDIRLLMMDNLGLTSDGEVELKIKYGIDDSTVDQIIKDEKQTVVLEYIAKNEDEFNKYTEEEKETVVKLIADGVDLDNYEVEDKEAIVNYIANGEEVDGWTPEAKDAFVKYLADGGEIDKFDPKNKESWVVYDTDTTKPDGYDPNDPDATVTYKKDTSDIDGYNPPNFIRTVTYKIKEIISKVASGGKSKAAQRTGADPDGKGGVNGTANVNGTTGRAFAQGNWRTRKTENALTGELGREIVVTPNNQWYTVGDNGAEFVNIPRGSIVFNHKQTEELLSNGKAISGGGRAKALVGGTAFSSGTGGFGKVVGEAINTIVESAKKSVKKASKKSSSSSSSSSSSGSSGSGGVGKADGKSAKSSSKSSKSNSSSTSSSEKEFEESFDWIEVAISRIERAIDKLSQKANNVYKSWSSRNKALTEEIAKVQEEIELQDKAADRYLQEANSVGLSSSWAGKVRNGEIDLDTIKDEDLADKIGQYRDWYEKYLDCIDAAEELKEAESELYAQKFENVQTQYDAILQGYGHTEAMLNEYISQAEAKGHIISKKYYEELIANEKSSIAELKKEQAELIAERDNAVAEGKITRGSEAWLEQCAAIDEVTQAIESANTKVIEFENSIRDIDWEIFDLVQERISAVSEEADFLIELMSNKRLFEDDGKLTSQGLATMALHAQNYNNHMYQSDEYGAEIADLDAQIAEDPYNQDLIDRRNELLELQRESVLAAEDEKNAIKDLVEESINLELDALQELIDKKNEALESERDLYEYQKKVKEQTEEIASLEKQLAAYSGDDSEEAKQKIQQIKVDLETARQDLEETEYDKFISDTSAMLDTLYTKYELILNQRLDNIDFLLSQVIDGVNAASSLSEEQLANLLASLGEDGTLASALGVEGAIAQAIVNAVGENGSIKNILNKEVTSVGTTLSNAMNNIWSVGEGNAKSILTMYGEGFQNKLTTTNTTLNSIKASIDKMVDDVDKDAQKKATENKTSTSAKKDPTKDSSSEKKTPAKENKKSTSSGDGKPKVGDKVKFVSGKYYYDSQGKKPLGSKNRGKEVYITKINTKSWTTHPYHVSTGKKLGSGDLGWLKLDQLSGYATGKYNFSNDELAWTQEGNKEEYIIRPSDGAILTPVARKGSVLNAQASSNIWNMANSPADFIKENLKLDASNIPNNSSVSQSYTQHIDNVVFRMDNVKNYDQMLSTMQKDKNFERLIDSMTIGKIAGKSSLAKCKSIR